MSHACDLMSTHHGELWAALLCLHFLRLHAMSRKERVRRSNDRRDHPSKTEIIWILDKTSPAWTHSKL